jgi:hypothetical protein
MGRVPLQSGNPVQPQNALPALLPLRATRRVMALEHSGLNHPGFRGGRLV